MGGKKKTNTAAEAIVNHLLTRSTFGPLYGSVITCVKDSSAWQSSMKAMQQIVPLCTLLIMFMCEKMRERGVDSTLWLDFRLYCCLNSLDYIYWTKCWDIESSILHIAV